MSNKTLLQKLFGKSSLSVRLFLFNSTLLMLIGVWMTGFDKVHWSIYVAPAFFGFAVIFGVCPGINLWRIVTKEST